MLVALFSLLILVFAFAVRYSIWLVLLALFNGIFALCFPEFPILSNVQLMGITLIVTMLHSILGD